MALKLAPTYSWVNVAGQLRRRDSGVDGYVEGWGMPIVNQTFDQPGATVDTSFWTIQDNTHLGSAYASWCSADNTIIEDGILKLRAIYDPDNPRFGRPWSQGSLTSQGKFSQRYGRFEILMRMPMQHNTSAGMWPSWWGRDNVGNGECDFMESWGTPSTKNPSAGDSNYGHYTATIWPHTDGSPGQVAKGIYPPSPSDLSTGFHRYICEWTPEGFLMYLDDDKAGGLSVTYAKYSWLAASFPSEMNLRLTMPVAGTASYWGTFNENTKSPSDYEIKHVRVWEYK